MPRRNRTRNRSWRNCDIPLRWQIFGGAIFIIAFMHLTQLATEALLGERVPQKTEQISTASRIFHNDILYYAGGSVDHDDADELPSMHLLMEPVFNNINNNNNNATTRPEPIAINVNMTLNAARGRFAPGRPLLTLPLIISTVPSARYDEESNPLLAYDSQGQPVRLSYRDEDPVAGPRIWYIRNDDDDDFDAESTDVVLVSFTAPYRKTDKSTGAGTRVDLRRDVSGGGLMGQGMGFLPIPLTPSEGDDQGGRVMWNVTLEWHLAHAPAGVRGAWSFGDSDKVTTIGPLDRLISHAIFAVGYLERFPAWDVDLSPSTAYSPQGQVQVQVQAPTYWFDPSPYNITALAHQTLASYTRIAAFFHATEPLRVFIRRIETAWGGTGATQSFLLEYSDETPQYADALSLAEVLAHETVHEFALLDPVEEDASNVVVAAARHDPSWQEDEGTWYVEGVASYVGDLVGLNSAGRINSNDDDDHRQLERRPRSDMLQVLNNMMQAYYTSPRWVLEMDYGDVLANFWRSTVDVTRVSYSRGFVLLAQLDGMIYQATGGKRSMDDVIFDLYQLRVQGKPCTIHQLNKMVSDLIGREAFDRVYTAFFRGDLIVPAADCLERHGLGLVKQDWHRFELGFETDSLRAFHVSGLVKGSNAEKVGVREGDTIVRSFMLWTVEDSLDGKMKMTVLRDGQEVDLEWLPRSNEVVEAYGWVEIDGGEDPDEL